jgi:sugar lactone lactonase YvrE
MKRLIVAALALLTGCNGGFGAGGGSAAMPAFAQPSRPDEQRAGGARRRSKGQIRLHVPRRHRRRAGRNPARISTGTQSISIAINGATPSVFNTTPASTNCTTVSDGVNCTFTLSVPYGNDTFAISTFDAVGGGGAALDRATADVPVTTTTTSIGITLDGIPSTFVFSALPSAFVDTAFTSPQPFSVSVRDAAGFIIVGAYASPITLTNGDTSGATAIATGGTDHPPSGQLLSSNDTSTLTYDGSSALYSATITATAPGAHAITATFTPSLPGNVYVADYGNSAIKEILAVGGVIPPSPTIVALGTGVAYPNGVAVDRAGDVFSANASSYTVTEMLAVNGMIPASPTVRTIGTTYNDLDNMRFDASGNLFICDYGAGHVMEALAVNGSIPASPTVVTVGPSFAAPSGVAVDAKGDVFVTEDGNSDVREMVAVAGAIPPSPTVLTIATGLNLPTDIAFDGSGNLYVTSYDGNSVVELLAVNGTVPPSPSTVTLTTSLDKPSGLAVDASGNVYVSDNGTNSAKELLAVGGSVPVSPTIVTLASGFIGNVGIAVR